MSNPRQKMEVGPPRRHRYRLNMKKLFTTVVLLGCITALSVLLVQYARSDESQTEQAVALAGDTASAVTLEGKSIVIDAGHGGFDPGAMGASGVREDELNLKVAQYLKSELESLSAQVIMTRGDADAIAKTKDEDMAERRRIIEDSGSDIVISIHMNSHTDPSTSGPLVLFMPGSSKGQKLADTIMDCMNDALKADGKTRSDNLYILKSGNQPCVLVECGYLSNATEEAALKRSDYQKKIAAAICKGAAAFLKDGDV